MVLWPVDLGLTLLVVNPKPTELVEASPGLDEAVEFSMPVG